MLNRSNSLPSAASTASDEAAGGRAAVEQRFRENYAAVQYNFVEFVTEHLADCSRTFGGDLQQVVLLGIIGQVYLKAMIDNGRAPQAVQGSRTAITSSRLADATGIPRETTRRKLADLARRGWIERVGTAWQLKVVNGEAPAKAALAALDDRAIDRLARLYVGLRDMS